MRKTLIIFSAIFFTLSLFNTACSRDNREQKAQTQAPPPAAGFHSVTPAEAMRLIQTRKELLVLDVRSPQELREGAIPNSRLVPFWDLAKGVFKPDPDKPLLVVCAVGGRSFMAGQFLARNGVREVYNLKGGIAAWKQAGLPLVYPGQ